jgi:hypothetical protein
MQNLIPPLHLRIASIVTVSIMETLGLATHYGLVSNAIGMDGLPMVLAISSKYRRPTLVTWSEFTQGMPYKSASYPSQLHPTQVFHNAFLLSGKPYDFWTWNCECFAKACHGLPGESDQVKTGVAIAALAGIALLLAKAG